MGEELDGIWAVVISAGGKYIGRVNKVDTVNAAVESLTKNPWMELGPVYELAVIQIPVPGPAGQLQMTRDVRALPLGVNLLEHTVHTKPTDVWFLALMQDADQEEYKDLVRQAIRTTEAARAARAGITTATQMPGGHA